MDNNIIKAYCNVILQIKARVEPFCGHETDGQTRLNFVQKIISGNILRGYGCLERIQSIRNLFEQLKGKGAFCKKKRVFFCMLRLNRYGKITIVAVFLKCVGKYYTKVGVYQSFCLIFCVGFETAVSTDSTETAFKIFSAAQLPKEDCMTPKSDTQFTL